MSKKIQLTIPKPCHENWDAMTPVEKGKFCGSCEKQVVDFSAMSDRQVAEFFKKPSTGSVCGRFMVDQLERDIEIPKKRIPWLRYFFSIALPAFFFSKAGAQSREKMGKVKPVTRDTVPGNINHEYKMMGMVALPDRFIPVEKGNQKGEWGSVVDAATGTPLANASVQLFSTFGKENIKVNRDGSFVIDIYRKITVDRIEISMPGYIPQTLKLADFMKLVNSKQPVKLVKEDIIVGEIAMVDCVIGVEDTGLVAIKETKEELRLKERFITGEIIDQHGDPVQGMSVRIKGTNKGGAANEKGQFRILASQKDTLQIRGICVEQKDVVVGDNDFITVHVRKKDLATCDDLVIWSGCWGKTINGVVVDENGIPVNNAAIRISGTERGVVSDNKGQFKINVKENHKLVATCIGFESAEITVGRENLVRIHIKRIDPPSFTVGFIVITEVKKKTVDSPLNKTVVKNLPIGSFRVFPNPVQPGGSISIEWKQTEEGYYTLELIDQSGKTVHQKEIWIDAEARLLNFDLPSVAAGNYFLVLINKKSGKKFSEKIIVQ